MELCDHTQPVEGCPTCANILFKDFMDRQQMIIWEDWHEIYLEDIEQMEDE